MRAAPDAIFKTHLPVTLIWYPQPFISFSLFLSFLFKLFFKILFKKILHEMFLIMFEICLRFNICFVLWKVTDVSKFEWLTCCKVLFPPSFLYFLIILSLILNSILNSKHAQTVFALLMSFHLSVCVCLCAANVYLRVTVTDVLMVGTGGQVNIWGGGLVWKRR